MMRAVKSYGETYLLREDKLIFRVCASILEETEAGVLLAAGESQNHRPDGYG